ncbi:hypothetical protein KAR91_38795 [Candidatus Pacearchaeota archaeon]|nr:hypothetical protein [Candidatus Pacearchaeota archaeon]
MKEKKGQVTIFIIVAIVVVVAVIIFFLLRSSITESSTVLVSSGATNQFIAECVSEHVGEVSRLIIENGGYVSKGDYKKSFEYAGEDIPYLCYTEDFYARCETQEPVLISHLNEEIYNFVDEKIDECFEYFKSDMQDDGFTFTFDQEKTFTVELMPGKVNIKINKKLEFEKAEEKGVFRTITVSSPGPLYDMALIVQRIVKEEALWVNSEYLNIIRANTWADIEKLTLGDSNEIYTVSDTRTDLVWKFAVLGGRLYVPE